MKIILEVFYYSIDETDIAVDGWAITMLRKENVGFQSLCNGVGQLTGFFIGYYYYNFNC